MTHKSVRGIVPVLPTPFRPDESVDLPSLKRIVQFCVEQGFSAICLPAYASEFYKLDLEERYQLVATAVQAAKGEIQVIAQSNHYSGAHAAKIAVQNEKLGADVISVAVPRLFEIGDIDVFRFLSGILGSTSLPVLVQDFNPGGPTINARTAKRLSEEHSNFRYLKLEQPLMAPKVVEILESTNGKVQVLEGWGGMYLLEGIEAGICGAMPGLGVADILQQSFDLAVHGDRAAAMDRFEQVLPYLVFSLQNMELLLQMEKKLLVRRSLIRHDTVRQATSTPDEHTAAYVEFLIGRMMHVLTRPSA